MSHPKSPRYFVSLFLTVLLILSAALPCAADTGDISPDQPAPDFAAQSLNGGTVRLSDHLGKPVIVNFWTTWCGPCRSELPYFDRAYAMYGDRVVFMMVDLMESREEVAAFIGQQGYSFPVFLDSGAAAQAYAISAIPLTLFITPEGRIAEQHLGSMDESSLFRAVGTLLGQS